MLCMFLTELVADCTLISTECSRSGLMAQILDKQVHLIYSQCSAHTNTYTLQQDKDRQKAVNTERCEGETKG